MEEATREKVCPQERLVMRAERGWAGHFICADRCLFRRNTLLTCRDVRIVVSTVGLMRHWQDEKRFEEVGLNRHFETMAFHAKWDGRYWDADVHREVEFDSPWAIEEVDADDRANDMHEAVVEEITGRLTAGHEYT